jgi:hypothetical protein
MTFDLRTLLTYPYCSNGAQCDFALLKENAVILIDSKMMEVIDKLIDRCKGSVCTVSVDGCFSFLIS